MSDLDRPSWCPDRTCLCLTGYDSRMCVGRLRETLPHGDMFNTHSLCLEENRFYLNDADAYYLRRCLQAVREDVSQNRLWCGGKGTIYDFAAKG